MIRPFARAGAAPAPATSLDPPVQAAVALDDEASASARAPVPGATAWLVLLATLGAAGLLLAFQQVVSRGVEQGATRQRAMAARADAGWQCNALAQASRRAECWAQLNSNSNR